MLKIEEVRKSIFLLHFKDPYDAPMHFLRYQEYYESSTVRGEKLTLIDLMERYVRDEKRGSFTYPDDWDGFNIPSWVIFELHEKGIEDLNRYDRFMLALAEAFRAKVDGEDFYIIGTASPSKKVLSHEIAHGLFYTNKKYRAKMKQLVKVLPAKTRKFIFKELEECRYHKSVHVDETQAYLSNYLIPEIKRKDVKKHQKEFKKVLKKYKKSSKVK